jgi:hypothetical protein
MKDKWYADDRDLIKWGGILHLCNTTGIKHVIQVAYYRKEPPLQLRFDRKKEVIPKEVTEHFRDIEDIKRLGKKVGITIDVVKSEFSNSDREAYTKSICQLIQKQTQNQIVFLDPDTGLAPQKVKVEHVASDEVLLIWQSLKPGDFLVLYQHNPHIPEWKNVCRKELAKALSVKKSTVRMWEASKEIKDVVFYYYERGEGQ